jgi:acyl transferase domain-containing protein
MTSERRSANEQAGIAVVGLHGRFPGACDVREFWENLRGGRDVITSVPPERWDHAALFGEPGGDEERTYATTGGFMSDAACFDCAFFNILPREAQSMDPQQRLFLQTAWQALEDAGYPPKELAGTRTGVYVGIGHPDYPALMRRDGAPFDVFRATGIVPTAIANRVSFSLDLRGPSEVIDTACSGSLVAIHRAIRDLECGECDLAIAGGVNLLLGPELFIGFAKAGMLSRTGRCRVLDAGGDGYVRGEGVAALILRPLEAAEADGDFIYGIIRGCAENHGGKTHSFTAPGVSAQADVITRAWSRAGHPVQDASLIELHGTGTPLGDPIEIKALKKAYDEGRQGADVIRASGNGIALGALKSHAGHLEAAAGVAGVIKTLLSMQNRMIPPNLHFRCLNPQINFADTPFYMPVEPVPLADDPDRSLLAGVSSFGFGGVNAHVVIESHQRSGARRNGLALEPTEAGPYLFAISARDEIALSRRVKQLLVFLESTGPALPPSQTATLQRLGDTLGLGKPAGACGGIRLDSLDLSEEQLALALRRLTTPSGSHASLRDVRDCMTAGELAESIDAVLGHAVDSAATPAGGEPGLPQVALPDDILQGVSLSSISYSLMRGRDAMPERLAVVAGCKNALTATLRRFLANPQEPQPGLSRGSVRSPHNGATLKPANHEGVATTDLLDAWARHWVANRTAKLQWNVLHRHGAPARIPLPAYPFERTQIWYTAGKSNQARMPAPGEVPAGGSLANQPASLRRESAPAIARAPSDAVPGSLMGLAHLLEHLFAASGNRPVYLSQIEIGRPLAVKAAVLTCRTGVRGRVGIVQCLCEHDSAQHVLVQARQAAVIAAAPMSAAPFSSGMLPLDPTAICDAAALSGLTVAPQYRCIRAAKAAPWALTMTVTLPRGTPGNAEFWPSLLLSVLTGCAYCLEQDRVAHSSAVPLFLRRANALVFNPRAAKAAREIVIERDVSGGALHVTVRNDDGGSFLELRGLQLHHAQTNQSAAMGAAVHPYAAVAS